MQVTYITMGVCLATWVTITGLLLGLAAYLPMTADLPSKHRAAVASLAGTLMMARSPASMVCAAAPHIYGTITWEEGIPLGSGPMRDDPVLLFTLLLLTLRAYPLR